MEYQQETMRVSVWEIFTSNEFYTLNQLSRDVHFFAEKCRTINDTMTTMTSKAAVVLQTNMCCLTATYFTSISFKARELKFENRPLILCADEYSTRARRR